MSNHEEVYKEFSHLRNSTCENGGVGPSVAIFRVAIETAAQSMGLPLTCYLMSRLLTTTLGIANEDDSANYDQLSEFEDMVQQSEDAEEDAQQEWAEALSSDASKH